MDYFNKNIYIRLTPLPYCLYVVHRRDVGLACVAVGMYISPTWFLEMLVAGISWNLLFLMSCTRRVCRSLRSVGSTQVLNAVGLLRLLLDFYYLQNPNRTRVVRSCGKYSYVEYDQECSVLLEGSTSKCW